MGALVSLAIPVVFNAPEAPPAIAIRATRTRFSVEGPALPV